MKIQNLKILLSSVFEQAQQKSEPGNPVLATISVVVPTIDLLTVFSSYAPHTTTSLWFGLNGDKILGLGVAYECQAEGEDRFSKVSEDWQLILQDSIQGTDSCPIALGGFRFDLQGQTSSLWQPFGDASLIIPRITIKRGANSCSIVLAEMISADTDIMQYIEELLVFGAEIFNLPNKVPFVEKNDINLQCKDLQGKKHWEEYVQQILQAIGEKRVQKVVGARTLQIKASSSIPIANVLHQLYIENPAACVFAFSRQGVYFIGATPEILLSLDDGHFQTMALAGSVARSINEEEDLRLGQQLLSCEKERQEHDFVVQTLLKDLQPLCSQINIDPKPSLHRLRTLQHLITRFEGFIHEGKNLLDIVAKLHPTPAVGGVPRHDALSLIREHEGFERGWYAAPVGWLSGNNNGEFMVALRSGLIFSNEAILFAGCGLVAASTAEQEYQETQLKFTTMLDGIGYIPIIIEDTKK